LPKTVVIGAINWDVNLFIDSFPRKGEEVVVTQITHVPGGKAGNVAVAAARLLGPNQAAIFGGLGKDSIASEQVRVFEQEGVVVSGLKSSPHVESGQAYVVIDEGGENIIHTYFGANATFTPEDLDDPTRKKLISEATVITIMDPPFETALRLAVEAKRVKKIVAWDPGVKSQLGADRVRGLVENVDYVVANESEVENLTWTSDPDKGANMLMALNRQMKVVTKLGVKGSLMHDGKERLVSQPFNLESRGMKVVNTVGCGDAFLGAFVAAISEGRSDEDAMKWGNCAGGLKATKTETRGSPNRETLFKYLE
jgi:ribokinase